MTDENGQVHLDDVPDAAVLGSFWVAPDEGWLGRDLKALNWDGYNYARITKEAKLHLCNNAPIAIEITLRLGGKVDAASNKGVVTLSAFNQSRLGAVS